MRDLKQLKLVAARKIELAEKAAHEARTLVDAIGYIEDLEKKVTSADYRVEAAKRVGAEWKREAEELYRSIRDEPIEELP